MVRMLTRAAFALLLLGGVAPLCASIWLAQVSGSCTDAHGKPLPGATILFHDPANGRKFTVLTNANGEFFYIAVEPSIYDIELSKDGKSLLRLDRVSIQWSKLPTWIAFDLERGVARVSLHRPMNEALITNSDLPQAVAPMNGDDEEAALVGAINHKLAQAKALGEAGDWDSAISMLRDAVDLDPSRDVPWAHLADAYWHAALAAASHSDVSLAHAAETYLHAIGLRPAAAYHNNLGQVYLRQRKPEEALREFRAAAEADPARLPLYDFNAGAVLFDLAQADPAGGAKLLAEALALLGNTLQSQPDNAEAHYLYALALLRQASAAPEWKLPAAAIDSLKKYLALSPAGRHADEVRAMLDSLTRS